MAEEKNVLLSLTVDIGESANRIAGLTTVINQLSDAEKNLRKEMAATDTTTKEGKARYAELARELATITESKKAYASQLREESKQVQHTIQATGEYERSLQGMADKLAEAKKELRGMNMYLEDGKTVDPKWKERAAEVDALNEKVKKAEETYGVYARNVGNYSNSILDAFGKMNNSSGKLVAGIKQTKTAMDALGKAGPMAMLSLVAMLIMKVVDALDTCEENTNEVASAMSAFKAIGDVVTVTLQKMGEWIGKAAKALSGFIQKHAEEYAILGKVNERMRERQEIERMNQELAVTTRENTVQNAKDERDIAELLAKSADKYNHSAKERIQFLEEAKKKRLEMGQREIDEAQIQLDILKATVKQTRSSKEENDKLAEAEARVIQAETAYLKQERELNAQISETKKQIASEAAQAAQERKRADDEAAAATEAAAKAMQEAFERVKEMALGDTVQYQIEKVTEKYKEAFDTLEKSAAKADEKDYIRYTIKKKMEEEIAAIKQKPIDEQLKAEKAAADEALKAREKAYAEELAKNWQNADEQYRIRKQYIDALLNDETVAAEKKYELEKELADLQAEHAEQRISTLQDYANQMASLMGNLSSIADGFEERRTNKIEAENEKQKAALQERLDRGIISQESYDKKVAAMDAELDAEKAKIARRQAAREKALSAMQIAINTASAIMKIWAEVPKMDFGVSTGVLTTMAAAVGATQLAAVLAEPLPKAAKGGTINGPSHAMGGALIEGEGGERIIAANPSKAFPELLNLISYIGKHSNIPNTGYANRVAGTATGIDYDLLANKVGDVLENKLQRLRIYTSVTDIKEAERNYALVEAQAKF